MLFLFFVGLFACLIVCLCFAWIVRRQRRSAEDVRGRRFQGYMCIWVKALLFVLDASTKKDGKAQQHL